MNKTNKAPSAPREEFGRRLEQSEYFSLLTSNFERMLAIRNGRERAYVAALALCFDVERAETEAVNSLVEAHGFDVASAHSMGFVMARDGFIKFAVRDCAIPGVNTRRVRTVSPNAFAERFDRAPHRHGPSDMWCSIAEWYALLSLGRPPRLPKLLYEYAKENEVDVP